MDTKTLLVCLSLTLLLSGIPVLAQDQCSGLTNLASNANTSVSFRSCGRDADCTSITCTLTDAGTRMFVQKAELVLLPCASPTPQVEFQLFETTSGSAISRFDAMIETSGDIKVTIQNGPSLGVLTTMYDHRISGELGIEMSLTPQDETMVLTLIPFTSVPLNMSACAVTTTPSSTLMYESTTVGIDTTTDGAHRQTPLSVLFSVGLCLTLQLFVR